jgi:PleD family two-component response regulator
VEASTGSLDVTVSVGVCAVDSLPPGAQLDIDKLLEIADQCLYDAKLAGRNRTVSAEGGRRGP